jgi:hypothetical protein
MRELNMRSVALTSVLAAIAAGLSMASTAVADEGMWTFDKLPLRRLAADHQFVPPPGWVDHLRNSAVRLAQGCSGSFISANGLVLSNHHCARECLQGLSTPGHPLIQTGFLAATAAEEKKCPDLEVNQLVEITHVSDQIKSATAGHTGSEFRQAEQGAIAAVEKTCNSGENVRCDVVTLFHGGTYDLYKYRRYQDVRLVFAVEEDAASFGDTTVADWPLHSLDMSLVRVYEGGKPLDTRSNNLAFASKPAKVGDLVFVAGNPGQTERLSTVSQLEEQRDVFLPMSMGDYNALNGMIAETVRESPELAEQVNVFESELAAGRYTLQHRALSNTGLLGAVAQAEAVLRAKVASDSVLAAKYGGAWNEIAEAMRKRREMDERFSVLDTLHQQSDLMFYAGALVRNASQLSKPNAERLHQYRDSNQPFIRSLILSTAPVYPAIEARRMTWVFSRLQLHLGTADPAFTDLLGHEAPHDLAQRLVEGTKLGDLKVRQALLNGGPSAIAASTDPLLVYMREKWEPRAIIVRESYEDTQATVSKNAALIDRARLAVLGPDADPDATSSPRVSYGVIRGYRHDETEMPAETTFGEAFAQNTGRPPFRLPKSWIAAKPAVDLQTPLDFVSTADTVGGNSGSPVVDRAGRLVGLIFAGNDASEAAPFGYDDTEVRAIAVSMPAMRMALKTIYHADRIVAEIDKK